jgi:non-ribosomal peptide synthetase component E (peptide arylation enzyme)
VDLDQLRQHLENRGVSRENWPERREVAEELPSGSGGKIVKSRLRDKLRA